MGNSEQTLDSADFKQLYENACTHAPAKVKVIAQNMQTLEIFDELFYAPVSVNGTVHMKEILDSGSMACTFSEEVERKMLSENVLPKPTSLSQEIRLIGCGDKTTRLKCICEVELIVHGERSLVPILVVPQQRDDLLIGTNVIKFLNDINIDLCAVNFAAKEKPVKLLEKYNDVFSKHALECEEVKPFVHCIRLTDERLFQLP